MAPWVLYVKKPDYEAERGWKKSGGEPIPRHSSLSPLEISGMLGFVTQPFAQPHKEQAYPGQLIFRHYSCGSHVKANDLRRHSRHKPSRTINNILDRQANASFILLPHSLIIASVAEGME
jgi:hypothetical protein